MKRTDLMIPAALVAVIVVLFQPSNVGGGITDRLCASVTGFLDDEADKAGDAEKRCKEKCSFARKKHELVESALKTAKASCARGEAPDIKKISKGLDKNAKDKLGKLYNSNSRMFDGTAKLPSKDFDITPAKPAATSIGKGGQVASLKAFNPDIKKTSPLTEFSLQAAQAGPSGSGMVSAEAPAKAKNTASGSGSMIGGPCCNRKTGACTGYMDASNYYDLAVNCCNKYRGDYCCSAGSSFNAQGQCVKGGGAGLLDKLNAGLKKFTDDVKTVKDAVSDKYHELKGDQKCGATWHNPDKECCVKGKVLKKCGNTCYDTATKCCRDGKAISKCGSKCYSPEETCCVDEAIVAKRGHPESLFDNYWKNDPNALSKHKEDAVTAGRFVGWAKGHSLTELVRDRAEIFIDNNPGSDVRFIRDPANPDRIIDMRHFFYFGEKEAGTLGAWFSAGDIAGYSEEVVQKIFNQSSAFDPQDFYSNALGAHFFREYYKSKESPLADQLSGFFKQREELKNEPTCQ